MKAFITLFLTALASAHAISLAETQLQNRDFQPVALNFQAGPVSYGMDLVADGKEWFTSALKPPILDGDLLHILKVSKFGAPRIFNMV